MQALYLSHKARCFVSYQFFTLALPKQVKNAANERRVGDWPAVVHQRQKLVLVKAQTTEFRVLEQLGNQVRSDHALGGQAAFLPELAGDPGCLRHNGDRGVSVDQSLQQRGSGPRATHNERIGIHHVTQPRSRRAVWNDTDSPTYAEGLLGGTPAESSRKNRSTLDLGPRVHGSPTHVPALQAPGVGWRARNPTHREACRSLPRIARHPRKTYPSSNPGDRE